jgi:hypothetical protein
MRIWDTARLLSRTTIVWLRRWTTGVLRWAGRRGPSQVARDPSNAVAPWHAAGGGVGPPADWLERVRRGAPELLIPGRIPTMRVPGWVDFSKGGKVDPPETRSASGAPTRLTKSDNTEPPTSAELRRIQVGRVAPIRFSSADARTPSGPPNPTAPTPDAKQTDLERPTPASRPGWPGLLLSRIARPYVRLLRVVRPVNQPPEPPALFDAGPETAPANLVRAPASDARPESDLSSSGLAASFAARRAPLRPASPFQSGEKSPGSEHVPRNGLLAPGRPSTISEWGPAEAGSPRQTWSIDDDAELALPSADPWPPLSGATPRFTRNAAPLDWPFEPARRVSTSPSNLRSSASSPAANGHHPDARRGDPWPALPEAPPVEADDSAALLRAWERRRRLDREQRGVGWNG